MPKLTTRINEKEHVYNVKNGEAIEICLSSGDKISNDAIGRWQFQSMDDLANLQISNPAQSFVFYFKPLTTAELFSPNGFVLLPTGKEAKDMRINITYLGKK